MPNRPIGIVVVELTSLVRIVSFATSYTRYEISYNILAAAVERSFEASSN